jgi:hypothetical protein
MNTMRETIGKCSVDDSVLHSLQSTVRVIGAIACSLLLLACASRSPVPESTPSLETSGEHHTVALLGASGMVGHYLLQEALARGYTVRALVRTPAKLDAFRDRITIIQGDARDPVVIEALLRGSDVVISALGPVKADGDAARFISTTATENILGAMEGAEISQFMVVSGAAVVMPGDDRNFLGWWMRTLVQLGLRDTLQDKQAEYELLTASSANWMLVRCPLIDAEPFLFLPVTSLVTPPAFRVRAGELARFMLDQIDVRQFIRQGPFIGSRQVR